MLQAMAPSRAIEYFLSVYESIPGLDEMMQLAVIELIRKESKGAGAEGALKVSRPVYRCLSSELTRGRHDRLASSSASSSYSIRAHTLSSTRLLRL